MRSGMRGLNVAAAGGWLMAVGWLGWDVAGLALGAHVGLDVRTLVRVSTLAGVAWAATGLARLPSEASRGALGGGAALAGLVQSYATIQEWGQSGWVEDALPALGLLLVAWACFFVAGQTALRIAAGGFALVALGVLLWVPINVAEAQGIWMPGTALLAAGALVAAWRSWLAAGRAARAADGRAPA